MDKLPWNGTLDATDSRVVPCVQSSYDVDGKITGVVGEEDCLRLNGECYGSCPLVLAVASWDLVESPCG